MVQNLAVVRSTTEPAPNIDTTGLQDALKAPKIYQVGEDALKAAMLFIYTLIGLRGENYPKGIEKDMIHTYIRQYYGGHTLDELRLAFTMAVQSRLPVEATVFENFTPAYFSRVMDAFRKWATQEIHHLPKARLEYKPPRYQIELEYSLYLLRQVNKLPCKIKITE